MSAVFFSKDHKKQKSETLIVRLNVRRLQNLVHLVQRLCGCRNRERQRSGEKEKYVKRRKGKEKGEEKEKEKEKEKK